MNSLLKSEDEKEENRLSPSKKESTVSMLLRRGFTAKSSTDSQKRGTGSSKEKKVYTKPQPKTLVNFYTKKGAQKGSPRQEDKGKSSGKLSETQKLILSTPKEKPEKDHLFQSMVYHNPRETHDREKEKAALIVNKISKKIANPKSSLDGKRDKGLVQQIALSHRIETPGTSKEVFKTKAKSFRSSNSIHNIHPLVIQDIKKKS